MSRIRAVLLDRVGILVEDVPGNADPDRVRPVVGAYEALALLRFHGVRTGFLTHQPGVSQGRLTEADVRRVDARVEELLGPFDVRGVCPHAPADGCHCRPPLWAAGRLCTAPADCVVIGDTDAHMEAARRAGAHGILVTTARPQATTAHTAGDLGTAVRSLLTSRLTHAVPGPP